MNVHVDFRQSRTTATPAATMRTLVSPTTEPGMPIALWRTELAPGTSGPQHSIDTDQFVVVVSGCLVVTIDGVEHRVGPGDGIKLPGGVTRVIAPRGDEPTVTLTVGEANALASVGDGDPVTVPWSV